MAKKEIAEKKDQLPAGIDFGADMGAGMEGADKESFAIPFLQVIQKMSPQVDESDAAYMPEAKAGQFLNTVTQQLLDGKEGIQFVPCAYQRRFIKWGPRNTPESGFKGEMLPEEVAALEAEGKLVREEGRLYEPLEDGTVDEKKCNIVNDVRNHFGLLLVDGVAQQVLLSLTSTQIKKSKQMMSLLSQIKVNGQTPPTWLNVIKMTTVVESNDSGSWHGVRIEPAGFVPNQEVYNLGKEFHSMIAAGEANVKYEEEAENSESF